MKKIIKKLINYCLDGEATSSRSYEEVKGIVQVWIPTTTIMWFYVVFSYYVFDFPTVAIWGLGCTIIHTLSPVIYKYTKSSTLTGLNVSLTGLIFQYVYCIYNGGVYSPSAIWFTLHPVIISFFSNRKLIYFSVGLNVLVVTSLTYFGNHGYLPVDTLPGDFTEAMTITSLIGLDILIATYTIVFINNTKTNYKKLENRNELIENLIRIISHDINNSLTIADICFQGLNSKPLDIEAKKKIDIVKRSNEEILQICNMVREWMKSNDQEIQLKNEKISVDTIINYVKTSYSHALEEKNIDLRIVKNFDEQRFFFGDYQVFCFQVLNNIFTNAIKFSNSDGQIDFILNLNSKALRMSVIDYGIGMPKEILENLSNPSKNWSRKGTNKEKGTGFGMPIVYNLIRSMGLDLEIESKEVDRNIHESGTKMTITIPYTTSS